MWNKIQSWFKKEEKKTAVADRAQPTVTVPPKPPVKSSMGKASQVSSTPSYVAPPSPSFQDNLVPYLVLDSFESKPQHKESVTEPSYSSHKTDHSTSSYSNSDDSSSRSSYSSSSDYGSSSSSSSDYSSSSDSSSSSYSSD